MFVDTDNFQKTTWSYKCQGKLKLTRNVQSEIGLEMVGEEND